MGIRRAVPDLASSDPRRAGAFSRDVLGFEVGMDLGRVVTLMAPGNPTAQVTVLAEDRSPPVQPDLSVEVDDVDGVHAHAVARGFEIVHPLTDAPWGVRRFFVRDPDGHVVNVLSHRAPSGGASGPEDPGASAAPGSGG
jgi:catechol 2,3-dioxygenase-like lactoylglutathione lyase family enzyme